VQRVSTATVDADHSDAEFEYFRNFHAIQYDWFNGYVRQRSLQSLLQRLSNEFYVRRPFPEIIQTNYYSSAGATQASPAGFVLPGISFGIVPIGFYMFSAYWVVFTAVLLWGAWSKRKVTHRPSPVA